jgi:TRAP-type C4-dicarboxylate transport system permease small subunit
MSEPVGKADGGLAGLVFRGLIGATALGLAGWFGGRKLSLGARRALAIGGAVAGIALAPAWRPLGVDYFDNMKGWLQEGSTLTLIGGLRGIATRLTLWLALLGGSLATAAGKHIHIDVVFRFLPKKLRLPTTIASYVGAAIVCFAAVWGFFDHIAIESYGAKADDAPGQKIEHAAHEIGRHFFLTRKQVGLDFKSMPHVLAGERYDVWMTGAAWNAWIDDAGFEDHYPKEQVQVVRVPEGTASHSPLVVSPDGTSTRGILAHTLGLVIPFGLFAIALRFLLRALLTLSGHYEIDVDAAHKEDLHGAQGGA